MIEQRDYPHILVQKLDRAADPLFKTAETHKDYRDAILSRTPQSPNVGYTVKGFLVFPIQVGHFVFLGRYERNDQIVGGTFRSSTVIKHDPENKTFETMNSLYRYEFLPDDEESKKMFDIVMKGEL